MKSEFKVLKIEIYTGSCGYVNELCKKFTNHELKPSGKTGFYRRGRCYGYVDIKKPHPSNVYTVSFVDYDSKILNKYFGITMDKRPHIENIDNPVYNTV